MATEIKDKNTLRHLFKNGGLVAYVWEQSGYYPHQRKGEFKTLCKNVDSGEIVSCVFNISNINVAIAKAEEFLGV